MTGAHMLDPDRGMRPKEAEQDYRGRYDQTALQLDHVPRQQPARPLGAGSCGFYRKLGLSDPAGHPDDPLDRCAPA